jgi:hypothetical protein
MTKTADPKAMPVASLPMQTDRKPQRTFSRHFGAPIFVTGLPRSDTSPVTGLLGASGLRRGVTVPGGRENPRGFIQSVSRREQAQEEMLQRSNFDPPDVRRRPPPDWLPDIPALRTLRHA